MYPLVHTKINLELMKHLDIDKTQKYLMLAGGVLPDLCCFGLLPMQASHLKSREFAKYLKKNEPSLAALGAGFLLHCENPEGLDWFAHSPKGFIRQNSAKVIKVIRRQKIRLGELDLGETAHKVIEFACESFIDGKSAAELNRTFRNLPVKKVAFHLAKFFKQDEAKIKNALRFLKFFNFDHLRQEGQLARIIQNSVMFEEISRYGKKGHSVLLKRLNFVNSFRIGKTIKEVRKLIAKDFKKFAAESKKNMHKTVMPKIRGLLR